jgi:predicted nucleic acid-binding protein
MKPKVYIETSIPSFYYEVRTEPEMTARREWTRQWWDELKDDYLLVTSVAVLDELHDGDYPNKDQAIELLSDLQLVSVEPEIAEIVRAYIQHKVMPNDPVGDALHLALASFHKCDFLLTWNCRHLANANKFGHIRRVNAMLGLYIPLLVTPLELLGGRDGAEG